MIRYKAATIFGFLGIMASLAFGETTVMDEARKSFDSKDFETTVALLVDEIKNNPGHEEAYALLAQAYEKQGKKEEAIDTWSRLQTITNDLDREQEARLGLLRTRGPDVPDIEPGERWENDPYRVEVSVNWDKLKADADGAKVTYINKYPPIVDESFYFQVIGCTEYSTEVATKLCEAYTKFLLSKYFVQGQEWVLRVPIIIYKNHQDYVQKGGFSASSAGVTYSDTRTGVPIFIAMYMLDEDGNMDRECFEGTLPHEITHMVLHEFFGGNDVPRWLDEGLARRMEQSRKHYEEAAKTGRDAIAGEYYRFRSLFDQKEYPARGDRTWRFYEQSATIVLFLLEQGGPDSAAAFLQALKAGKSHDEAAAGALGIPVEGAVDEFEKRWFEWARNCYIMFRDKLDNNETVESEVLPPTTFPESFDTEKTIEKIQNWSEIKTTSMNKFKDLGESNRYWKIENNKLVCTIEQSPRGSLLGVRMNEEAPMVMRCKVRAVNASNLEPTLFGIAMLDHRGDDSGIQVMVQLNDRSPHQLSCVVSEDIAIYLDGVCCGRTPALLAEEINEDIDWPLAFVGYAPVEISDIEAGLIEADGFVRVEPPAEEKDKDKKGGRRRKK